MTAATFNRKESHVFSQQMISMIAPFVSFNFYCAGLIDNKRKIKKNCSQEQQHDNKASWWRGTLKS